MYVLAFETPLLRLCEQLCRERASNSSNNRRVNDQTARLEIVCNREIKISYYAYGNGGILSKIIEFVNWKIKKLNTNIKISYIILMKNFIENSRICELKDYEIK